ncbi:YidH family protein [Biostraticola tofi]|uniref:Putative membrane protein n=1 Tax=Biostraticola tofi TaxID=466109 RepID=A0A4R3Z6Z9_9GAMM|nr:DUF202 domain-containing protein [Biostraticola tofi]TCW00275.1 putative membrane protein [Biostraticola tofi]
MNNPTESSGNNRRTPWWLKGKTPDYRFSLANERTFLAWIRTALAFLAGAIAIDQFADRLGSPLFRVGLAVALATVAALLGLMAYRRWAANELAMRTDASLPATPMLLALAVFISAIALAVIAMMLLS